ncbi:OLC1v1024718C1 [Oldenlandia corymbosa var. corymbosa]|uniref:OLC1v1024718C1 n=1 Tax=Oldenlandia corymbosa var. corymbosa TaxID=529605 RepID=A0AAV1C3E8_OLDCO|nr:OLC1v1024718C1 [Oldenlandia corymbosa var. corymbosa]
MELTLSSLFIGFILVFFSVRSLQHKFHKSRDVSTPKLPPGPWKLPIVGNIFHFAFAGSLPHRALRNLSQRHGQVMHLQLGEVSTVVVSGARAAKEALKTNDLALANRQKILASDLASYDYQGLGMAPYGEYWRQMRKICVLELFSMKKFAGSLLFERMKLGIWTARQIKKLFRRLDRILDEIIQEHKEKMARSQAQSQSSMEQVKEEEKEEEEDIVDVLLKINERGDLEIPIKDNNIKAIVNDIFAGGTETTASTTLWAMSEMMRNPRVLQRAQAEVRGAMPQGKTRIHEADLKGLSYLKLVIKETLRLYPPVPLLVPRECREKCQIQGYDIPIGTKFIVNGWAVNRDPEFWIEPESFRPERFLENIIDIIGPNFEYIPFRGGRRMCPGFSFGLAVVELALAQLLYHFDWKIPGDIEPELLDMTELFSITLRRKNSLCLEASLKFPFE